MTCSKSGQVGYRAKSDPFFFNFLVVVFVLCEFDIQDGSFLLAGSVFIVSTTAVLVAGLAVDVEAAPSVA
jgi:hypothetical protein